uniref:phosphopyruvate hydratase n=1 Tax=Florenciella parvula TaxID=236787 RepID=A0A7S2FW23_9STRA|mmetsp:Transcript_25683/g.53117  ORF Transcript_25683/g.53117 Transcript_25683/m.53117 type:complete len:543 (+) Transcript_25683:60-1688(+)
MDSRSGAAVDTEREEIEQYMTTHALEMHLNQIVNDVVKEQPEDPFVQMSTSLQVLSAQVNSILGVTAREALNASGTPALEVTVETIQGTFSAMTTIGPYDNDTQRFGGKGLLKSVDSVEKLISDKLVGRELNQPSIDALIQEEPTPPANVVLAVSMACCRAAAKHSDLELHEYIAQLGNVSDPCIPVPVFSVINGADAASSPLHLKSVTVTPVEAGTFEEALEIGVNIQAGLVGTLENSGHKYTNVGSTGGLAPPIESGLEAMRVVMDAARDIGCEASVMLGLDVCSGKIVEGLGDGDAEGEEDAEAKEAKDEDAGEITYDVAKWVKGGNQSLKTGEDLTEMYIEWLVKFSVLSLEDPFHQKDSPAFMQFKERLDAEIARAKEREAKLAEAVEGDEPGDADEEPTVRNTATVGNDPACFLQLVGSATCSTEAEIDRYHEEQTVNTLLLTMAKGRTVSGAVSMIGKAQSLGWGVVASIETDSAETPDDFIAHLAVGCKAGQLKAGGLRGGEFVSKYNALLRIAQSEEAPPYASRSFRSFSSSS